ncbi:MAG TPA: NAD(P)H-hydrate dehydratase [Sedimentisphaerales bacterium]|nr:NAD(P)H-hydrate dehydratase [Sedimentisphaerales bacterium]
MRIMTAIPRLKPRSRDAHKGDFGKVCIVAGSVGMSGAAALTARAALRSGAGLARVAVPRSILPVVSSIEPCCTTIPLDEDEHGTIAASAVTRLLEAVTQNDVFAVGPGLGVATGCKAVVESLIAVPGLRMVLDADGLNNLAAITGWRASVKASLVLTPHPGEMSRLWRSVFRQHAPADRLSLAQRFAAKTSTVVVLKGHQTVVADTERVYVNGTGNAGMATGGSGDVLTGVIAALMGQGLDEFDAAVLGTYVHGVAGDMAAESLGQVSLIATDIIETLPKAFLLLEK